MNVQIIDYPGFRKGSPGQIAYVVDGNNIYFAGLTPPHEATSTINAAEAVIVAICTAGGVHWKHGTFHDVQTHRGYNYPVGSYIITQLEVSGDQRPNVTSWIPVAMSEDFIQRGHMGIRSSSELVGVPAEVLEAFKEHIEK